MEKQTKKKGENVRLNFIYVTTIHTQVMAQTGALLRHFSVARNQSTRRKPRCHKHCVWSHVPTAWVRIRVALVRGRSANHWARRTTVNPTQSWQNKDNNKTKQSILADWHVWRSRHRCLRVNPLPPPPFVSVRFPQMTQPSRNPVSFYVSTKL